MFDYKVRSNATSYLAAALMVTFTGFEGIPFATTNSSLVPAGTVEGMSNSVETIVDPVATPMVLWLCVVQ